MKTRLFFILLLLTFIAKTNAQVGVNTENPKATLDVNPAKIDNTTAEGIIAPKLSLQQLVSKDAQYTDLQTGAIVYVKDISGTTSAKTANIKKVGCYYFDGTLWQTFTQSSGQGWGLTGNSGTDVSVNFLGTTDDKDLVFKRNNVLAGYLGSSGYNGETNNTVFGVGALNLSAANPGWNVAVGNNSLRANISGGNNTAVGSGALRNNTSGTDNTAIGFASQSANTTGNYNISLGSASLDENTTGSGNTAIGAHSLGLLASGINNTALGNNAASGLTTGSNNIAIGVSTGLPATASYQMNIGNLLFGTGMNGNSVSPAGNIGIGTSSPASKLHINGDLTVGTAKTSSSDVSVVVRNNSSGLVGVAPQINLTFSSVASGATATMDATSLF